MKIPAIKKDAFLVLFCFGMQLVVWFFISQRIKPDFTITPTPPSRIEMDIASLGDEEFGYRMYGQILQNAGDTFGETIPLKDYDFAKLQKWFFAVDALSPSSEYVPSVAAFYYGQSQNVLDCKYVIDYLVEHADLDPAKQWRWYQEAIYLSAYRMEDYDSARKIAAKLISVQNADIPLWAKTTIPFLLQKKGDLCAAFELISKMDEKELKEIAEDDILSVRGGVHNFMLKVILDKIQALKNNPDAIRKCFETQKNNRL